MLSLLPEVGADDIVQHHLVDVVPIISDQSQLGQSLAVPPGLKLRPAAGGLPIPGQYRTGDRHVLPEHRQLQVPVLLLSGQPSQADPDRSRHRSVPLGGVGNVQRGRPRNAQLL
jgi:hypothetical protein